MIILPFTRNRSENGLLLFITDEQIERFMTGNWVEVSSPQLKRTLNLDHVIVRHATDYADAVAQLKERFPNADPVFNITEIDV